MALSLFAATSCNKAGNELSSGVCLDNLDTTANPVDDFYQYACGGWLKSHPLDAEHSRYGAFDVLAETNQEQLRTLIDSLSAAKNEAGSLADKIATLYNVGMDSVTLQKQGAEPIQPYMNEIAALSGREALQEEMTRLHNIGIYPFFALFGEADAQDANQCIAWIYQTGIGMGDRDYYLEKDSRSMSLRSGYVKLMAEEFALSGYDKISGIAADKLAKMVMDLETRLAKAQYDKVTNRDPFKTYNKKSLDEAETLAKAVNFKKYFAEMGLPKLTSFNMCQPEYIQEVAKVLATENETTIKAYYAWNVINSAAAYLSDDFVNANFEFFGRQMSGTEQLRPRWKRVTGTVDGAMGEALGELYVAKYFPPEAKERMLTLVDNLKEAFGMRIKDAQWMDQTTKEKALDKLSSIMVKVGYPNKWRDYSGLQIKKDSYFANVIRSNEFDVDYMISKIDKPVDREEWGMTPQTVNAYYNPTTNEICFPAGILQKPFFDMNADDAVNYGAIGVVIGHEMTHGFDDQGRQYDKEGNLNDWWTEQDAQNFKDHAQVLVDCFNKVVVATEPDTVYANGALCLGENIADNGGLHISYMAMQNAIKKGQVKNQEMDGFSAAQRFFLAYAGVWASNIRPEAALQLTQMDVHSLAKNRVNVTLPHVTEFVEAWGVKEGNGMWIAPADRVVLW